jgi:hypothetical protein
VISYIQITAPVGDGGPDIDLEALGAAGWTLVAVVPLVHRMPAPSHPEALGEVVETVLAPREVHATLLLYVFCRDDAVPQVPVRPLWRAEAGEVVGRRVDITGPLYFGVEPGDDAENPDDE